MNKIICVDPNFPRGGVILDLTDLKYLLKLAENMK